MEIKGAVKSYKNFKSYFPEMEELFFKKETNCVCCMGIVDHNTIFFLFFREADL